LRKLLEQAGIDLSQLRLANAIPFRPIEYSKDRKLRNRTLTIEEIDRYGAAVLTDIRRSRPGVVIVLGNTAARLFRASRSNTCASRRKDRCSCRAYRVSGLAEVDAQLSAGHGDIPPAVGVLLA
jgi:DNA polymerase